MRTILFSVLVILLFFSVVPCPASQREPGDNDWQLINRDDRGNLLYVAPASPEGETNRVIREIWLKFETRALNSPSPMLFLSELDCAKGLIKRLEVKLYNPTCSTDNELVQTMSFDGKWDTPSQGIETDMKDFICNQAKERP